MEPTFQSLIAKLHEYWGRQGCIAWLPYHEPVGAGTFNTATFLRVLGPEPWNVAYVEPSFRPDDGRYAENPNRVQMHHQFQVIMQPAPADPQRLYLGSLEAIGLDLGAHDVRFVEDNWESPAIGAWGLGWEVWLDGLEVTQFTYFQQTGGLALESPAVEYTYGLERIAMYLQKVDSLWDIKWDEHLTYGDILREQEIEFCKYDFEHASVERMKELFKHYIAEARTSIEAGLVVPAHDYVLKCSHTFNTLDSRGAVGLAERAKFFGEIRDVARSVAKGFVKQREELGFPLLRHLPKAEPVAARELPAPKTEARDFVLELGVEELAADVPEPLLAQLSELIEAKLAEAGLTHGPIHSSCTPRRLIVEIEDVAGRQPDSTNRVKGPQRSLAEKNPKALEGFCKRNNVDPSKVTYETIDGTEHAVCVVETKGRGAAEVLADLLPGVLSSLKSKRTMRWLSTAQLGDIADVGFNRPVRWIVALLGDEIVPFVFANVASGRHTQGGRWDGAREIEIESASTLVSTLTAQGLVVSHSARRALIREQLETLARKENLRPVIKDSLLDEVAQLVERPTAFVGRFESRFSALPSPVLMSVMEKHLRCFALEDSNGDVVAFMGVRNGGPESIETVQRGFERVLRARFTDAAFFIDRDARSSLDKMNERVTTLTFAEGLGSMRDKSQFVRRLAPKLVGLLEGVEITGDLLDRAADLSKADLGSQMVIEMSSLQGEMGAIYARQAGENAAVAAALREQYLPKSLGDALPESPLGLVLALADRIDTLVALFSKGAEPTGSADPFGLRREAVGIISILRGKGLRLDLAKAFALGAESRRVAEPEALVAKLLDFTERRLQVALKDAGHRHDVIRAVLSRSARDPVNAERLVAELGTIAGEPKYDDALTAYLRCARILAHAEEKGFRPAAHVEPARLVEEEEKLLHQAMMSPTVSERLKSGRIVDSFDALKDLVSPTNKFFDAVMVLTDEAALREQRLALIHDLVAPIAGQANLLSLERPGVNAQ